MIKGLSHQNLKRLPDNIPDKDVIELFFTELAVDSKRRRRKFISDQSTLQHIADMRKESHNQTFSIQIIGGIGVLKPTGKTKKDYKEFNCYQIVKPMDFLSLNYDELEQEIMIDGDEHGAIQWHDFDIKDCRHLLPMFLENAKRYVVEKNGKYYVKDGDPSASIESFLAFIYH